MTDLGIDVQYSSAYNPSGNGMAKQAVSRLKMAIKKNGLGSSLNNQSSSVPGAGTASERLLGYTPRFHLPLVSRYMSSSQREDMLASLRDRRDKCSQKLNICKNKDFVEGQRLRFYDHHSKKYCEFGLVTGCPPSSDGLIHSYTLQLDTNPLHREYASWL